MEHKAETKTFFAEEVSRTRYYVILLFAFSFVFSSESRWFTLGARGVFLRDGIKRRGRDCNRGGEGKTPLVSTRPVRGVPMPPV